MPAFNELVVCMHHGSFVAVFLRQIILLNFVISEGSLDLVQTRCFTFLSISLFGLNPRPSSAHLQRGLVIHLLFYFIIIHIQG